MHTLLHYGLPLVFAAVIASVFTLFVIYRPGAAHTPSRRKLIGIVFVGLVIAGVLWISGSIYAPPSA